VSVIMPVLNETGEIAAALTTLAEWRAAGCEVIVCDGGSRDDTLALARAGADRVVVTGAGRARQMNAGAAEATGEVLLFLHADCRLPAEGLRAIRQAITRGATWGRFDVTLSGRHPLFRLIESLMNWRSRLTGIATGDQALFVRRDVFVVIGGFAEIELMEDIELSKRLRRRAWPACQSVRVYSSSRRWEAGGILRTVWLMWRLRFAYWLGADPRRLAKWYYR
jgi:rSAM/selenodomain-associated transferase 2